MYPNTRRLTFGRSRGLLIIGQISRLAKSLSHYCKVMSRGPVVMRSLYPVTTIVSLLFVHGAVAGESSLWSTDWLFGRSAETAGQDQLAEAKQKKTAAEPVQTSQDKTASPPQGTESRPAERTETTNFDNWILSCRE